MAFDPDKYLATKQGESNSTFSPDEYLKKKGQENPPYSQENIFPGYEPSSQQLPTTESIIIGRSKNTNRARSRKQQ